MEITGKIIQVLETRGGVSARTGNEWKVASYVLETMEQYPKRMLFEVFGADKISSFNIQVGETMIVSFDVDAHEYNGRWYNQIRAWRVSRDLNQQAPAQAQAAPTAPYNAAPQAQAAPAPAPQQQAAPAPAAAPASGTDDLPF